MSRVLPLLSLLAVWEAVSRFGLVPPGQLPPPSAILAQLVASFGQAQFLSALGATLVRLALGLSIALCGGIAIGLLTAQSRLGTAVLQPVVRVLAPIPKIAFYPAFLLLLGFGHSARVLLIVTDAIFPVMLAALHGARSVDEKLLWSARAAGMSRLRCVTRITLPAALPSILTGARVSVVIGCVVVFFAEMVSPDNGLGELLVRAARSFQSVSMFVPLVVISLIGLLLDRAVALVQKSWAAW